MNAAAIIDALSVTDANLAEMVKLYSGTLTDSDSLAGYVLKWFEHLDGAQGLPLLDKILMTTRFALCAGYTQALRDVQTVQRAELAAMSE